MMNTMVSEKKREKKTKSHYYNIDKLSSTTILYKKRNLTMSTEILHNGVMSTREKKLHNGAMSTIHVNLTD